MKKTLVIGASENPERYSNMAVRLLRKNAHEVIAFGIRAAVIDDVPIITNFPSHADIDTVTLYLNPAAQREYYDHILSLRPKRIIFNPGTENPEFEEMATSHQIETIEACTLVMLNTGQY